MEFDFTKFFVLLISGIEPQRRELILADLKLSRRELLDDENLTAEDREALSVWTDCIALLENRDLGHLG